jgi:hypothetical protein
MSAPLRVLVVVIAAASLLAGATSARAQPFASAEAAFTRFLAPGALDPTWFAPALLAELPLDRLTRTRDDLARHGALVEIARDRDLWSLRLTRARVPARIALDPQGRIRSLFFEAAIAVPADLAAALAGFDRLPGRHALLVLDDSRETVAREADRPLGVGSAFKMLVLRELATAETEGRLRLDQVVSLRDTMAPGSGIARFWPADTPVTLGALAVMMISLSDNAATDTLMEVIGRERLSAAAPARNRPLMNTRELQLLRLEADPRRLSRWRLGDETMRARVLAELPRGASLPEVWGDSLAADVDHQFSARELCALAQSVGARPEMRVNPGPAAGTGWEWVAFKGGSTDTSISYTFLAGRGARTVCVSAIWNAPRIARDGLRDPVRGLLALLAGP